METIIGGAFRDASDLLRTLLVDKRRFTNALRFRPTDTRETKARSYRAAALAGGGKREVARRRNQIFYMRLNASNGVVGL